MPDEVVLSCRAPASWLPALQSIAQKASVPISAVMRAAIANYVAQRSADPLLTGTGRNYTFPAPPGVVSVEGQLRERATLEGWSVARLASELAVAIPAGGDEAQWIERLELEAVS